MFGVNNAAHFKVSLTRQEMMLKMDRGQKILKGIPVEGYAEEPIGAHFEREGPKVIAKRSPTKSSVKKARVTSDGSALSGNEFESDASAVTTDIDGLPGSVPTADGTEKKRKTRRIIKRKQHFSSVSFIRVVPTHV